MTVFGGDRDLTIIGGIGEPTLVQDWNGPSLIFDKNGEIAEAPDDTQVVQSSADSFIDMWGNLCEVLYPYVNIKPVPLGISPCPEAYKDLYESITQGCETANYYGVPKEITQRAIDVLNNWYISENNREIDSSKDIRDSAELILFLDEIEVVE